MWGYPAHHHCYRDSGTIQLSSQLQWLSSKCEVGSVSFILPLHLRAPRPGKRGKFTPQWNVSKLRFQSSQTFRPSTSAVLLMQLCGFWAKRGKFREKNVSESSHSNAKIFHLTSIYFPRPIIFEMAGSFLASSGKFQSPLDFHQNCDSCPLSPCLDDSDTVIATIVIIIEYQFPKNGQCAGKWVVSLWEKILTVGQSSSSREIWHSEVEKYDKVCPPGKYDFTAGSKSDCPQPEEIRGCGRITVYQRAGGSVLLDIGTLSLRWLPLSSHQGLFFHQIPHILPFLDYI